MPTPQPDTPASRISPTKGSSSEPVTVVLCRITSSSEADLEARIRRWTDRGWRVRRREPRVMEGPDGPTHGVLLVLERESHPEQRRSRRPIPRTTGRREASAHEVPEA